MLLLDGSSAPSFMSPVAGRGSRVAGGVAVCRGGGESRLGGWELEVGSWTGEGQAQVQGTRGTEEQEDTQRTQKNREKGIIKLTYWLASLPAPPLFFGTRPDHSP